MVFLVVYKSELDRTGVVGPMLEFQRINVCHCDIAGDRGECAGYRNMDSGATQGPDGADSALL